MGFSKDSELDMPDSTVPFKQCCGEPMMHSCTPTKLRSRNGYHNLWTCRKCLREYGFFVPLGGFFDGD